MPGHRHAAAITAGVLAFGVDEERVLAALGRNVRLLEAELVTLIDEALAGQPEQQKRGGLRARAPNAVAAETRHVADHVVVGQRPAWQRRAPRDGAAEDVDRLPPRGSVPAPVYERESHVQLIWLDVARLAAGIEDLAEQHSFGFVFAG